MVQYANSFSDSALGKTIANQMHSKNVDIIFTCAGAVGIGAIEAILNFYYLLNCSNSSLFLGTFISPDLIFSDYGFRAGVKAANPDAEVMVQYANSFSDSALGKRWNILVTCWSYTNTIHR